LSAALRRHGIVTRTYSTSRPLEACALTRRALAEGATTITAVGGDGTVHEVVNGLLDNRSVPAGVRLAVLPCGTGMDFARNIGARRGVNAALDRILAARERRVDLGYAPEAGRAFVNFAETGLGAAVVSRAAGLGKWWPGRVSFLVSAVGAALTEKNIEVAVTIDEAVLYRGRAVSVVVANGEYFGGGMRIAPRARPDDTWFDVLVLADFSRAELLSNIWKIYPGVHLSHPKVLYARGRRVTLEPGTPAQLDLDGELLGDCPTQVILLPSALPVLV
jgi:diacylglycerol kinase (ATP)